MRSAPQSAARSGHPRPVFGLAIWPCLLLSLTGCAGPAPISRRVDPPPAALSAPCVAGPDYPAGALPLGELMDIVAARETAAADCRARHSGLVASWPR